MSLQSRTAETHSYHALRAGPALHPASAPSVGPPCASPSWVTLTIRGRYIPGRHSSVWMVPPIALCGWSSRTLLRVSCDSACRIEYPPIGSPESPPLAQVPVSSDGDQFAATLEWGTEVRGRYEIVVPPRLIVMSWDFNDDSIPLPGPPLTGYLRVHPDSDGSRLVVHQWSTAPIGRRSWRARGRWSSDVSKPTSCRPSPDRHPHHVNTATNNQRGGRHTTDRWTQRSVKRSTAARPLRQRSPSVTRVGIAPKWLFAVDRSPTGTASRSPFGTTSPRQ